MTGPFDSFILLAGMRTGSNFLEANLNALEGVACHGEAFNPHFIGYPDGSDILGVSRADRDADPHRLLEAVRNAPGLAGFRYFHDHDPRVLAPCLDDPRCAKIVLTRAPVDSYVSWKIAQATGQWKLTHARGRKRARIAFDAEEFDRFMAERQAFLAAISAHLHSAGQTAFWLDYDDLQQLGVINGLAAWLGVSARLTALDRTLKVQNPGALRDKVTNYAEMQATLARRDGFGMDRVRDFEPARRPAVPTYVVAPEAGLIFLPVPGGPTRAVETWLAAVEDGGADGLRRNLTQKELRQWKRATPGHRSFTVLRHPLARAHHVFCRTVLGAQSAAEARLRSTLIRHHGLPLPAEDLSKTWTKQGHRAAFAAFLRIVAASLSGQSPLRPEPGWASQSQVLQGFAGFILPDRVIRESDLVAELPALMSGGGPAPAPDGPDTPFTLAAIHDAEIEALGRTAYGRDYMMFGFGDWDAG